MEDNIKQVVKDVRHLIATGCNNETVQARIENYIKERDEALSISNDVEKAEQLVCKCGLPKHRKGSGFSCMRTDCDMPIAN